MHRIILSAPRSIADLDNTFVNHKGAIDFFLDAQLGIRSEKLKSLAQRIVLS